MSRTASLLSLSLALVGCHFTMDGIEVDGERLTVHHEETLEVTSWPAGGLVIAAQMGDVRVEKTSGPSSITVQVYERTLGQAKATLEGGRLVTHADGAPSGIGRVLVRTGGPLPALSLTTGMGDVEVREVGVQGALAATSGMGDVSVRQAGEPASIDVESGSGDVDVSGTKCERVRARCGKGNLRLDGVESPEADFATGMGNVSIVRCTFQRVKADTGVGNIECRESHFQVSDFDTGLGTVSTE